MCPVLCGSGPLVLIGQPVPSVVIARAYKTLKKIYLNLNYLCLTPQFHTFEFHFQFLNITVNNIELVQCSHLIKVRVSFVLSKGT